MKNFPRSLESKKDTAVVKAAEPFDQVDLEVLIKKHPQPSARGCWWCPG